MGRDRCRKVIRGFDTAAAGSFSTERRTAKENSAQLEEKGIVSYGRNRIQGRGSFSSIRITTINLP
jgi:hypothetical protein